MRAWLVVIVDSGTGVAAGLTAGLEGVEEGARAGLQFQAIVTNI